jgi:hypothetical protein
MHPLAQPLMLTGLLIVIVGWTWVDIRFKKRLGFGWFSIRWETVLWPFYFNRKDWLSLLTVFALGFSMIISAVKLGVFNEPPNPPLNRTQP